MNHKKTREDYLADDDECADLYRQYEKEIPAICESVSVWDDEVTFRVGFNFSRLNSASWFAFLSNPEIKILRKAEKKIPVINVCCHQVVIHNEVFLIWFDFFWFKRNTTFVLAVCVSLLWQLKPTDFYFSRLCCKTPFSTSPRHAGTFATLTWFTWN